eukprot:760483-Hanusia_phi.AAC.2
MNLGRPCSLDELVHSATGSISSSPAGLGAPTFGWPRSWECPGDRGTDLPAQGTHSPSAIPQICLSSSQPVSLLPSPSSTTLPLLPFCFQLKFNFLSSSSQPHQRQRTFSRSNSAAESLPASCSSFILLLYLLDRMQSTHSEWLVPEGGYIHLYA